VPEEVENHEYRVAITPVGVHEMGPTSRVHGLPSSTLAIAQQVTAADLVIGRC